MLRNDRCPSHSSESELLFSSVFEQVAVGLAYLDRMGYYQMVNHKFCEIVGYSKAELLTKSFVEITHPEDLTVALSLTEQLFTHEISTFGMEKRYIRKDGTWAWAELNVSLLRSPDGQPKWLLAAITDTNDRKRSEAAQHQSDEQLRLALEMANIGNWSLDAATGRMQVSAHTAALLGLPAMPTEISVEERHGCMHPEDVAHVDRSISSALQNHNIHQAEYRVLYTDGSLHWLQCRGKGVYDLSGQPTGMLGVTSDITERKQTEEALRQQGDRYRHTSQELEAKVQERTQELDQSKISLRQQEKQFRTIFECAPIAIALTDRYKLHYLKVNQAMCDMIGYSAQELEQKTFVDITYPDDLQKDLEKFNALLRGEISQFCLEKRYIRKSGEIIWGDLTVTLIRDLDGVALYNLGMVVDITERKRAEDILRASEEQLRVSLQEKEVLFKEVHHRVKNNMQVVSSLLSLQSRAIQDPNVLAPLKEIQSRVKVMGMVHERFYQSEKLSKINFPEYVQSLIQDVIRSYSPVSLKTDLDLDIADVDLGIDTVIPCGLILHELVSNVIKHAFPDPDCPRVSVKFTANETRQCVLTVADNGIGLPESIQPNHATSLGLQIVTALTLKLHGTLECDRYNGTTFRIEFTY
jgi:PAS domain S-box-containing protein